MHTPIAAYEAKTDDPYPAFVAVAFVGTDVQVTLREAQPGGPLHGHAPGASSFMRMPAAEFGAFLRALNAAWQARFPDAG